MKVAIFCGGIIFGILSAVVIPAAMKPPARKMEILPAYQIVLAADGINQIYDGNRLVGQYQSDTTGKHLDKLDSIIWKDNE